MKTALALLLTCLAAAATAAVSTPPPPPASVAEVQAGTVRSKYVSPYTAAQAGLSSPTGGITATVAATIVNGTNANGTITLLRPAGTKTNFIPTADNDDARYTALANARTTAVSGDTILVGPGNYHSGSNSVAKNGVNWHFAPGATLYGSRVWDDGGGTATSFTVSGGGVFQATNVYACVWFTNTASVVTMTGAKILGRYAGVNCGDATLSVTMFEAITSTVYDAIWNASGGYSGAGRLFVTTPRLVGGNNGLELDGGTSYIHADFVQGGTDAAAPALNMLGGTNYLHLSQVACTNSSVATATFSGGDNVLESDRIQGKFSFTGGVLKMHALLDGGPLDVTPLAATADGLTLDNCVLVAGASVSTSLQGHPTTDHNVQVVGGLSYTVGKAPTLHALLTTYGTQTFIGDGSQLTGLSSGTSVAQGTNIVLVTNGSVVTIHGTATGGGSGIPQAPGGTGTNTDLLNPSYRGNLFSTNAYSIVRPSATVDSYGSQVGLVLYSHATNAAPWSFVATSNTNNWSPGASNEFRYFNDVQLHFGYNLANAPGYNTNWPQWVQGTEMNWYAGLYPQLEWYQRMTLTNGINTGGPYGYAINMITGDAYADMGANILRFWRPQLGNGNPWLSINSLSDGSGNLAFANGYIAFAGTTNRWPITQEGSGLISGFGGSNTLFQAGTSIIFLTDANASYGQYLQPVTITKETGPALIWDGTNSTKRWEFRDDSGVVRALNPLPMHSSTPLKQFLALPPNISIGSAAGSYRRVAWVTNNSSGYIGAAIVQFDLLSGYGFAQRYIVPLGNITHSGWQELSPTSSRIGFDNDDRYVLDCRYVSAGTAWEFRMRHVVGSGGANFHGSITYDGLDGVAVDTSDSGTGATVTQYDIATPLSIWDGNIGIGTNTPSQAFYVVGNTRITGTNQAAEFVGGGTNLTFPVSLSALATDSSGHIIAGSGGGVAVAAGTNGIVNTTNGSVVTVNLGAAVDVMNITSGTVTNFYTLLTNAGSLGTDGNGKMIAGSASGPFTNAIIGRGSSANTNALAIAPNLLVYTNGQTGMYVSNRIVLPNLADGAPAAYWAGQSYGFSPSSVHSWTWSSASGSDVPLKLGYFGIGMHTGCELRFSSSAGDGGSSYDTGIKRKDSSGLAVTDGNTDNTLVYRDFTARSLTATNIVFGTNGHASFATTSTAALDATGWTNTFGINATAYVTATAVAFTIKDRTATTLYTSPTLTATISVMLQPGWSVNAASGLAGTALPW